MRTGRTYSKRRPDVNASWFAVSRGIFDHPVVGAAQPVKPADPTRGAYSKMEAWLDLIALAAYKRVTVQNKGRPQVLERGQLMAAQHYLAERWNWTREAVRWFLKQLVIHNMITTTTTRESHAKHPNQNAVLTPYNYERYQAPDELEQPANNQRTTSAQPESNNKQVNNNSRTLPNGRVLSANADFSVYKAFEAYNALALKLGLQQAHTLTPDRRKKLKARLREHGGMDAWQRALANVEASKFLRGENERGWRAHLDFMLQASSFCKLIDGTYGNGAAHAGESEVERMKRLLQGTLL